MFFSPKEITNKQKQTFFSIYDHLPYARSKSVQRRFRAAAIDIARFFRPKAPAQAGALLGSDAAATHHPHAGAFRVNPKWEDHGNF